MNESIFIIKLQGGWNHLVLFATMRWKGLSLILLIVGVFAWTNWYFSPVKRLERVADDMLESASVELSSDDIAKMMGFLRVKVGGSTSTRSTCDLPSCSVTMSHYYFTHPSDTEREKTWELSVTVRLNPYFDESGALNFVPPKIEWRELDWRWSVGIIDRQDSTKNVFYSGNLAQLRSAPTIEGANTISSLLTAMAVGMNKGLHR